MEKSKIYKGVMDYLKKDPAYIEAEKCIDYVLEPCSSVSSLDDDYIRSLHAEVEEGGNEGIYVDLIAETLNQRMRIATWKTLDESPDAYRKMGVIAGLSTYAAYKAWREAA